MKKKIKSLIKIIIPKPVKSLIVSLRGRKESMEPFSYDRDRFLASFSNGLMTNKTKNQLDARITFHAHALEKGLSHTELRLGFGRSALEQLSECLDTYYELGYSKQSKAYENALSVLKVYIDIHDEVGYDLIFLKTIFDDRILEAAYNVNSKIGGINKISLSDKSHNKAKNFKDLFLSRWSVREYEASVVNDSKILEAISIAMKAPSICNRQSSRVTIIKKRKMIEAALNVQGGMRGYSLPPALLMVTTDTSAFVGVNERNQVYIDGGLFAMSLLLSLEYVSLATCSLNAMLSVSDDQQMRRILDVPSNENIIMFIAVGNFQEENKVPKSFRYDAEEIIRSI